MKEKKKFVLVVPTVVIVLAIAGILMIFYNRNLKDMSREDAKSLAQKVAIIENISCEIVTESNEIEQGQYVVDYKLKDNKMVYRTEQIILKREIQMIIIQYMIIQIKILKFR